MASNTIYMCVCVCVFLSALHGVNRFKLYFHKKHQTIRRLRNEIRLHVAPCPLRSSCHTRVSCIESLLCYHNAVFRGPGSLGWLDLLVASTLGHRSGPVSFGRTARTFRRSTVDSVLNEAGSALHCQVVSRVIVELERSYQSIRGISRVRALGLTWIVEGKTRYGKRKVRVQIWPDRGVTHS